LFISDQQRADTMPGIRAAPVRTPHLEWLSERGTLFQRAYCTTPMCSPARASLLAGLFPHTTGMVANHQARPISDEMHLAGDVRVLADMLKPSGYACAYTGKWHLGTGADRRGFSDFVTRSGDHDVDAPEQNDILQFARKIGVTLGGKQFGRDVDPEAYDRRTQAGAALLPLAFHPSMRDVQQAVRFIRQMESEDRPFLLAYSCHEPHPPFIAPRPFSGTVDAAAMPLPATRRDPGGARVMRDRIDWQLRSAAPFSDDDLRAMWAAYYEAIAYVDHLLGTLLESLIDTDQFDNTLILFTSDHGEMLGSHGMLAKGAAFYEELVNVPLLIRAPGRGKSCETTRLVSHVDLVPTILRWCGAGVPDALHGSDIRSLVEGGQDAVHDGVAFEFHSSNWGEQPCPLRGWRTERWKYVEAIEGPVELYDLSHDPEEIHNLAAHRGSAETLEAMRTALRNWQKETGDRWPEVPVPDRIVPKGPGGPWTVGAA